MAKIETDHVSDERKLFGGAFSCCIPGTASDISTIRDIPDNQEVFVHSSTDQSIMFDILEYQSHVEGAEAARYHYEDIASVNDAESENEVTFVERIPNSSLSMPDCDEAWFLLGRQMVAKFKEESSAKNLIQLHLLLYRLSKFSTDILVIMNSPIAISKESSSSKTLSSPNSADAWNDSTFKQMACSLKLLDPNIFGKG